MSDFKKWDVVNYFDSDEDMAGYLIACLEEHSPDLTLAAIGDISRAKGIAWKELKEGLSKNGIYEELESGRYPSQKTLNQVYDILHLKINSSAK